MVTEKDRVIKDLAEKLLRQQDYTDLKRELRYLLMMSLEPNIDINFILFIFLVGLCFKYY